MSEPATHAPTAEAELAAVRTVLRIIGRTPENLETALQAVADAALRLLGADFARIWLREGDYLLAGPAASTTGRDKYRAQVERIGPISPEIGRGVSGRAYLERRTLRVCGTADAIEQEYPETAAFMRRNGIAAASQMATPLLRGDATLGVLLVYRRGDGVFSDRDITLLETFADQAVIAVANARLFEEQAEALEREQATAEVLRVISRSPENLDDSLQAVADAAVRLCKADYSRVWLRDGDLLLCGPGSMPDGVEDLYVPGQRYPLFTTPGLPVPEALGTGRTAHNPNVEDEPKGFAQSVAQRLMDARVERGESPLPRGWGDGGFFVRTQLAVPLLRDGAAVGVLALVRGPEPRPFNDREIALAESFADQAMIAIENARLFRELQEQLEQQTATSRILEVLSSSPTELQPVLDAVVESAARLTGADDAGIQRLDGETLTLAASSGPESGWPVLASYPLDRGRATGRAIAERRTIHVVGEPEAIAAEYPGTAEISRQLGTRSLLVVPLLREGSPIGVLVVRRLQPLPFTDKQIALLETFAHQAVIAIENTRLYGELQASNATLREALEQQTATADVLAVISSAPTALDEVLPKLLARALPLVGAEAGAISRDLAKEEGFEHHLVTVYPPHPERGGVIEGRRPIDPQTQADQVRQTGRPLQFWGTLGEWRERYPRAGGLIRVDGPQCRLILPLLRAGSVIGTLIAVRFMAEPFTDGQIALLETFAAQAVIAIENTRLFEEIEAKSRELEEVNAALEVANRNTSAFLANMSHELRTPLNAIIGYTELIQEEAEDLGQEALLPDLAKVNTAARHLLSLISDILDLSKIEAGKMELYLEDFEVAALIRDVETVAQPLMTTNANMLVVECPDDVGSLHADLTKVRQALFNLLSNAAKFTEQGTITLTVRRGEPPAEALGHDGDGEWLAFTVADTGIGMSEEQLGRLFEAFAQAEAGTSRTYGGTGLGLAISRQCCRLMGGDITVTSEAGMGSTFTIWLPRRAVGP